MPAKELKPESFDESVNTIAEKIRTEREKSSVVEQSEDGAERQQETELELIRTELKEQYSDTESTEDGDENRGEGVDSAANLEPAGIDEKEAESYLDAVPEKYKESIAELLQTAVHGGILHAVAKAGKKNDPYTIDVFHDSLARFLHKRMQNQGLL